MRRIAILMMAALVVLVPVTVLAADAQRYVDTELGFSFELPEGMEYYGDMLEQAQGMLSELGPEEIKAAQGRLESLGQGLEKLPVYLRNPSDTSMDELGIMYIESSDLFDDIEQSLPEGVSRDEIDLYLLLEKEQQEMQDKIVDTNTSSALEGYEHISNDIRDFGGKLFLTTRFKMIDPTLGVEIFRYMAVMYYRDYMINIMYTNYNLTGDITEENAYGDFEEALETLRFVVVPSDKNARLQPKSRWIALVGIITPIVVIVFIAILLNRRKRRKREDLAETIRKAELDNNRWR